MHPAERTYGSPTASDTLRMSGVYSRPEPPEPPDCALAIFLVVCLWLVAQVVL